MIHKLFAHVLECVQAMYIVSWILLTSCVSHQTVSEFNYGSQGRGNHSAWNWSASGRKSGKTWLFLSVVSSLFVDYYVLVFCLQTLYIYEYLYNKRRYVCLSVMICVPYGRPNGWADRDQTWHTHSCPPRECFWQGQCQGHSRTRAGLTEVRNIRNAARKRHLANGAHTTSGRRRRRHLANDYETPSGRRTDAYLAYRGEAPQAPVLRPEDG